MAKKYLTPEISLNYFTDDVIMISGTGTGTDVIDVTSDWTKGGDF